MNHAKTILPALLGLGTGKLTPQVSRTDKGLEVEAEARRKDGCAVPVKAWVTEGRAHGGKFFLVTLRDVKPTIASGTNIVAPRKYPIGASAPPPDHINCNSRRKVAANAFIAARGAFALAMDREARAPRR